MQLVLESHMHQGGVSLGYKAYGGQPVSLPDLGAESTVICGCSLLKALCVGFMLRPRAQVLFCFRLPDQLRLRAGAGALCLHQDPLRNETDVPGACFRCLRNNN